MKMILKKNQVIISVIAIMLIAAGYMNYTANNKQTLQTAKSEKTEPKKETDKKADAPKGKTSTGNRRSRSRRKKNTDNNDNK